MLRSMIAEARKLTGWQLAWGVCQTTIALFLAYAMVVAWSAGARP